MSRVDLDRKSGGGKKNSYILVLVKPRTALEYNRDHGTFQGRVLYGLCIPGTGVEVLQNFQNLQARVWK